MDEVVCGQMNCWIFWLADWQNIMTSSFICFLVQVCVHAYGCKHSRYTVTCGPAFINFTSCVMKDRQQHPHRETLYQLLCSHHDSGIRWWLQTSCLHFWCPLSPAGVSQSLAAPETASAPPLSTDALPKIRSCHHIALTVHIKINTKNNRLLSLSKAL